MSDGRLPLNARINRDRTDRISRRQAHIALHHVRSWNRKNSNIDASSRRIVYGHLKRRIAEHAVSEDDVAFDSSDKHDTVRVAEDDVVDDDVIVGAGIDKTDAEVVALACVTIPT